MAKLSKYKLEEYQYGIHVRRGRPLYMLSGKKIYFGEWLIRKTDPIIIIEMSTQLAEREAPFYRQVNGHENIIRTFGSIGGNPSNATIYVQEYAPQGDLADCLMDNQFRFTQAILLQMFVQIADAMSYIASNKIVHGDLGCRNVLVFRVDSTTPENSLVKITDFGLTRWIEHPPMNEDLTVIPIRYCAPEILRHNRHSSYSEQSDVYSMGVLIWEALSNSEIPYSSVADDNIVRDMKLNNEKLPVPQGWDQQLRRLMDRCWSRSPQERSTFDIIKDELRGTHISEVSHELIIASSHRTPTHFYYELDSDVRMRRLLNDDYPLIYEAEWISETEEQRPIILIEKNEEPSEHEKLFYNTFKDHPRIVHTFGFVENDRGSTLILQERATHGNLRSLLESGQFKPTARVLVKIFSQIIDAMINIADQNLVHGDLRCENILVFKMHPTDPQENIVKLANFTLAHPNDPLYTNTDARRLFVPVRYCALEILRSVGRSNYSEFSDVYSMGALMWEACSRGRRPYDTAATNGEVRQRKLKREKLPRPLLCDDQLWIIMKEYCLLDEPESRFTFKQLKGQFSKINFETIEPYKYELNKNVRQNRLLSGTNGRFYEAEWIPKKGPPIVLLLIDRPTAEHEASLYMKLNSHPHIIHTFGLVKNDQIMLLQERALHSDLQTLLQNGNFQPSPKVLVEIFLQIIDAMIYVTGQDIVHGDLRCANILVFQMNGSEPKKNLVKLTNFSLARSKDQTVMNNRLPDDYVRYCAPEILQSNDGLDYSELSDVYSMGVLMHEACSKGEIPYGHRVSDRDVRQQRLEKMQLSQSKDCPDSLWIYIKDCWSNELDVRPNFEYLKRVLPLTDVTTINYELCNNCKKNIPRNEIENHQEQCSPKRNADIQPVDNSPVYFTRCKYCGERLLGGELEKHQTKCPPKPNPPPILQRQCIHCHRRYPSIEIENHEKICPSRPRPKPKPIIDRRQECRYCHQQYLSTAIKDHENLCPAKPAPFAPQPWPQPVRTRACTYCRQQYPLTTVVAHENSCSSKPRSCMDQLFSWVCCCCPD